MLHSDRRPERLIYYSTTSEAGKTKKKPSVESRSRGFSAPDVSSKDGDCLRRNNAAYSSQAGAHVSPRQTKDDFPFVSLAPLLREHLETCSGGGVASTLSALLLLRGSVGPRRTPVTQAPARSRVT